VCSAYMPHPVWFGSGVGDTMQYLSTAAGKGSMWELCKDKPQQGAAHRTPRVCVF
jgi:hypothetical protein